MTVLTWDRETLLAGTVFFARVDEALQRPPRQQMKLRGEVQVGLLPAKAVRAQFSRSPSELHVEELPKPSPITPALDDRKSQPPAIPQLTCVVLRASRQQLAANQALQLALDVVVLLTRRPQLHVLKAQAVERQVEREYDLRSLITSIRAFQRF